jgi:hypothetical protein
MANDSMDARPKSLKRRRPDRKRAMETHFARQFVGALPELAGATLTHGDRPDFRLCLGEATFGLELTALVRGGDEPGISPKQRMEWYRAVESEALRIWRRRRLPPMFVSLHWRDDPPLTVRTEVARRIVAAVQQLSGSLSHGNWLHVNDESELPADIRDYVRALSIIPAKTRSGELWASGFAAFSEVQPNELQREIDRKSVAASTYPLRHDGTAEGAGYSRGAFDRVFFLDFMGRLIDLRLMGATRMRVSL